MNLNDWIFIGLLSAAIVAGVLVLSMIFLLAKDWQQLRVLNERRPNEKRKQKKWAMARKRINERKKSHVLSLILFSIIAVACTGIALYGRHYQATNLGDADAANIASAYSLIDQTNSQMTDSKNDEAKMLSDMNLLAKKLSSYSNKRASDKLAPVGQQLLNRYYNQLSQLGQNLNRQLGQMAKDEKLRDSFIEDITKVKDQQNRIITYYSIKEDSLKAQQ